MKRVFLFLMFLVEIVNGQSFSVHSHNDYEQKSPFWTAYHAGASSIEVDVFLVDGELFASHTIGNIDREKTLESLYLIPLKSIIAKQTKDIQLLIDVKTKAESTLEAIANELSQYPDLISEDSKIHFVISGNRPGAEQYEDYPSFINFDYQTINSWPENMDKVALVSLPFYKFSFWKGEVTLSEKDKSKLKEIIYLVHSKGKKIRFWATPDTELAWKTLYDLGIDYINTDKPKECFGFLSQ